MNTVVMEGTLYQVTSGHYCAGLVVVDGRVVHAAPILAWSVRKDWEGVREYLSRKGCRIVATVVPEVVCPLNDRSRH